MTVIWSAIAGGFLGTLALTTIVRATSELGLTRMDLALLLGTTVTENRRKARAIGYAIHFVVGPIFALGYAALFIALGHHSWRMGAVFGALHAVFTTTVLANVILPLVHPRIATTDTAANEMSLIEPPGFLMLNYGRNTFLIALAAHVAFGAIVGWAVRGG
jgi:energy-converting hydrogenase Eha subunit A